MFDIGKYKHSRFWAIREGGLEGKIVCLCVYRKGAREVVRRLGGSETLTERTAPRAAKALACREGAVK